MGIAARHLYILGQVQGVFYRNWVLKSASSLGLGGWVRNRMDSSVEVWVEGPEDAVDKFIALAHAGPPAAKVERIDIENVAVQGFAAFEKKPSC